MRLRTKIGSFVAAVCVVGAIGAAPANAAAPSFTIPSASSLSALCKNIKDPKLAAACTDATKKLNTSKPADLKGLIDKYGSLIGGGSAGGVSVASIQALLKSLGGGTGGLGGIDLSKLLGGLGGGSGSIGGIDLSKLLAGLKK